MRGWGDSGGHALSVHGEWPVMTYKLPPTGANCQCVCLFFKIDSALFVNHHFWYFNGDLLGFWYY